MSAPKIDKKELTTITQTVGFRVPPRVIFEALTDQKLVTHYTQSAAVINPKVGGEYSLMNGAVTGKYEKVSENELVYTWRFKEWIADYYSTVTIQLEPTEKGTETKIVLTHADIPHNDAFGNSGQVQKCETGWQNFFWMRFNKLLGYAKAD